MLEGEIEAMHAMERDAKMREDFDASPPPERSDVDMEQAQANPKSPVVEGGSVTDSDSLDKKIAGAAAVAAAANNAHAVSGVSGSGDKNVHAVSPRGVQQQQEYTEGELKYYNKVLQQRFEADGVTQPKDYNFFSATVGKKNSRAMYHLNDSDDVSFLLAKFAWTLGYNKHDDE